eukprot:1504128-Amphidinium_carterae.1
MEVGMPRTVGRTAATLRRVAKGEVKGSTKATEEERDGPLVQGPIRWKRGPWVSSVGSMKKNRRRNIA